MSEGTNNSYQGFALILLSQSPGEDDGQQYRTCELTIRHRGPSAIQKRDAELYSPIRTGAGTRWIPIRSNARAAARLFSTTLRATSGPARQAAVSGVMTIDVA